MVNRRLRDSLDAATRRAKEARDAAGEVIQDTTKKVGDVTTSSAEKVADTTASSAKVVAEAADSSAETARNTAQSALSATAWAVSELQQLPGDVLDKMFPECPVPMFILPIGSGQEDYCIVLNLDEVFENLQSGIFVRPKIEAWASRDSGWDIDHLGLELKSEFTRQFDEHQEQLIKSGKVDIAKLESQLQQQSKQTSGKLEESASALIKAPVNAGLACLMLNPVTGFVTWPASIAYCGFALYNGHKGFNSMSDYLKLRSYRGATQRELRQREKELTQLESDLDSKNEDFRRAVANIDVRVHPQIRELYQLICECDGIASAPSEMGEVVRNLPDCRPYLENPYFLAKLPRHYRSLLTLI